MINNILGPFFTGSETDILPYRYNKGVFLPFFRGQYYCENIKESDETHMYWIHKHLCI